MQHTGKVNTKIFSETKYRLTTNRWRIVLPLHSCNGRTRKKRDEIWREEKKREEEGEKKGGGRGNEGAARTSLLIYHRQNHPPVANRASIQRPRSSGLPRKHPLVYYPFPSARKLPFLQDLSSCITFRHVTGRVKIILKISFQYRRAATNKRPQRWTLSKVFKEFDASVSLMRTCGIYLYSLSLFLQNILSIKNDV